MAVNRGRTATIIGFQLNALECRGVVINRSEGTIVDSVLQFRNIVEGNLYCPITATAVNPAYNISGIITSSAAGVSKKAIHNVNFGKPDSAPIVQVSGDGGRHIQRRARDEMAD